MVDHRRLNVRILDCTSVSNWRDPDHLPGRYRRSLALRAPMAPRRAQRSPDTRLAVPVLLLIVFVSLIGFGVVIPLLPFYASSTPRHGR